MAIQSGQVSEEIYRNGSRLSVLDNSNRPKIKILVVLNGQENIEPYSSLVGSLPSLASREKAYNDDLLVENRARKAAEHASRFRGKIDFSVSYLQIAPGHEQKTPNYSYDIILSTKDLSDPSQWKAKLVCEHSDLSIALPDELQTRNKISRYMSSEWELAGVVSEYCAKYFSQ